MSAGSRNGSSTDASSRSIIASSKLLDRYPNGLGVGLDLVERGANIVEIPRTRTTHGVSLFHDRFGFLGGQLAGEKLIDRGRPRASASASISLKVDWAFTLPSPRQAPGRVHRRAAGCCAGGARAGGSPDKQKRSPSRDLDPTSSSSAGQTLIAAHGAERNSTGAEGIQSITARRLLRSALVPRHRPPPGSNRQFAATWSSLRATAVQALRLRIQGRRCCIDSVCSRLFNLSNT